MNNPPSLNDVEQSLIAVRQPIERRLTEMQELRDRFLEHHRQSSAEVDSTFIEQSKRIRRRVREQQRRFDRLPQGVIRTLILCNPDTEAMTAIALIANETEAPKLRVTGWTVACVQCSFHLLRCRVGQVIPQGLVVSVNGSPVLEAAHRKRAIDEFRAPPLPRLEQRKREGLGRRKNLERFLRERRIREQLWQEQLFQRRRAVDQREQLLQDKLRRELQEKEESRQSALNEWDRDRNALMLGDPTLQSTVSPVRDEPDIDQQPSREIILLPEDIESTAAILRQMPAPSDVGVVLIAFALGCLIGLFVVPRCFSLFGAAFAAIASLYLRLAAMKRS